MREPVPNRRAGERGAMSGGDWAFMALSVQQAPDRAAMHNLFNPPRYLVFDATDLHRAGRW